MTKENKNNSVNQLNCLRRPLLGLSPGAESPRLDVGEHGPDDLTEGGLVDGVQSHLAAVV